MKKYNITYQKNGEIKNQIVTDIELELIKKEFDILTIKAKKSIFEIKFKNRVRVPKKELLLIFFELNLMLESNINISDAIDILIKSKKNKKTQKFLQAMNYALSNSMPISEVLDEFVIEDFVKDFLNISQNSSNLARNVDAIYHLLKEQDSIKKSFYKALGYPIFLFFTFLASLFIIFSFVIPSFKSIFQNQIENLPQSTKILLNMEIFFKEYSLIFIIIVSFLILFLIFLYKISKKFEYFLDYIFIKYIPIFSIVLRNLQLYKLFLVVDIMQKSKYEFHKAFLNSKLLVKNKYLLDKIRVIDSLLENGKSICFAFKDINIFDDIILNLLNTGEVTNSLEIVVPEIKNIYKHRFENSVNLMISIIQPLFLLIIASMILFIVLAIFTPIWEMGSLIK
ncbi:type II secretion system F family protein [Aliarcobacter skirrowii]|uniref:Type II secretion system F family protein n=1 Tax=Aliarcobacter skirrowii CCUG 10374 TaxID=1032239 RepID=A0AAD0SM67_9BACT|nr:type II secretion system F family protein [Aliarcobacter skirrowii]AXX85356.1 type II secretion/transformation system, F protein [Aliarcobacter skirrowii CCUG 10374]KAB0620111.1 type II secretion system F family protein [Aliarcobacter skirrowii CCUG 10374]RXI25179.1 type II secretion system F family protein [Aliarcobacter skirrowii CCUG 10374]SUU96110.1 Cholera toxin secretion protein epsF [Aliarcobacter skirrowii]HAC70778.1 type II secretion system F family protein [Aliarcobacter skirrowii